MLYFSELTLTIVIPYIPLPDDRKASKSEAFQICHLTQQTVQNSINYLYHSIRPFATNSLFFLGENTSTCQVNKPHILHTISEILYGHNSNFCGSFLRDAEHFNLTSIPRSILFGLMRYSHHFYDYDARPIIINYSFFGTVRSFTLFYFSSQNILDFVVKKN